MEHPNTACFSIIRQDYVAIAQNNKCAAMILSILEGYSDLKKKNNDQSKWITLSAPEMSYRFIGLFARKAILQAGKLLAQLGLVARVQENEVNRSYRYLLQEDVINFRIQFALVWDASLQFVFWKKKNKFRPLKSALWLTKSSLLLKAFWKVLALEPLCSAKVPLDPLESNEVPLAKVQEESRSIDSYSNLSKITNSVVSFEQSQEEEEIKRAIAQAPFMQSVKNEEGNTTASEPIVVEQEESSSIQPNRSEITNTSKPSPASPQNQTIATRLRKLNVPYTEKVRDLISKTDNALLQRNILALENYAAKEPLKSPIAAFFKAVNQNWQPKNDRQAWWTMAESMLGKERRDSLIAFCSEIGTQTVVRFNNGVEVLLDDVLGMSWDAIAQIGETEQRFKKE